MPFDPKNFLELSEQLYTDQSYYHIREAALRTTISRAYYAVFLTMRELVRKKLSNTQLIYSFEDISKSGLIHSCIKRIMDRVDKYLGYVYGKLFMMRKRADYELNITIGDKDAEEAIGIARKLMDSLTKIYDSIEVNKISFIIVDYYQKLRKGT
ncbi:MAG: hypothetical protein DRJ18_02100 [Candidatus Methanomethylicota archaeon]|nr:MAG: hypothetical protein DRJ18_02100 [Candidatus Verstraetearchaeota archaeon]